MVPLHPFTNFLYAPRVMNTLLKFYGTDWLAMLLTFLSLYYLGQHRRSGFIYGLFANACWLAFGILAGSIANIAANGIFVFLNIRGYIKWSRHPPQKEQ